jgi:hypothetical protein
MSFYELLPLVLLHIPLAPDLYVESVSMSDVLAQLSNLLRRNPLYWWWRSWARLQGDRCGGVGTTHGAGGGAVLFID